MIWKNIISRVVMMLVLLATLFLTGVAHAAGGGDDDPFGRWWQKPSIANKMDLDDNLIAKLDALYLERKSRLIDLKAALEKEKLKLKTMLDTQNPTRKEAMAQFELINGLRNQLGHERFTYFLDVRDMIGPERFKVLAEWYKKRHDAMREAFRKKAKELDSDENSQ